MKIVVLLVGVFLLLFNATLWFPDLPPGVQALAFVSHVSGLPTLTAPLLGVSGEVLLQGVLNGLVASGSVAVIYGLRRRSFPPRVKARGIPPRMVQSSVTGRKDARRQLAGQPSSIQAREAYPALPYALEDIVGIGPTYGRRLRRLGVTELAYLRTVGATATDRRELAEALDVSPKLVDKWVQHADFLRLPGVGPHYARLLDAADVVSMQDLASRDATILHPRLRSTNQEKGVVQRTPPVQTVQEWIIAAKQLAS